VFEDEFWWVAGRQHDQDALDGQIPVANERSTVMHSRVSRNSRQKFYLIHF
jgi:hypothetical protein